MKKWAKEDVEFLTNNYAEHGPAYCAQKLNRTYKSVQAKAGKLNLKTSWSNEDIQFLIDNYAKHGRTYCAKKLNKSVGAVQVKASRLNLTKKKTNRKKKNRVSEAVVVLGQENKKK